MIANTQNGFPCPFPSLGLSYWKKKSHTFAEQWDKNQLQWSFKPSSRVWNISFWSYKSNNCTLMVFFTYAFTYIDYPIAVLDLNIYHSSE